MSHEWTKREWPKGKVSHLLHAECEFLNWSLKWNWSLNLCHLNTHFHIFHQNCQHHLGFAGRHHGDSWKRKNPTESHFVAKLQSATIILTPFLFSSLSCFYYFGWLTALELLEFAPQLCFVSCADFRKLPKLPGIKLRGHLTKLVGLFLKARHKRNRNVCKEKSNVCEFWTESLLDSTKY